MGLKQKIIVRGPALSRSGYGEQTRFALRALRAKPETFDIYIINTGWGNTGNIIARDEMRCWIDETAIKTGLYMQQGGSFDLSLQVTIPPEFEKIAPVNIGYTAGIESTRVAPDWLVKANQMDKVLTISEHSKKTYTSTACWLVPTPPGPGGEQHALIPEHLGLPEGISPEQASKYVVQTPLEVVSYPVREFEASPIQIDFTTDKNFLVISQWGPRKNLDNTIRWFVEEFVDDPDAGLVLKTNVASDSVIDREYTQERLEILLRSYPERKCKIYLIHGELTENQLTWLYEHPTMQAMIGLSHGEGFGLPLFEAAACGLPLITVTWGGPLDFICKTNKKGKRVPHVIKVDYSLASIQKEAVWPGVLEEYSKWTFALESSYKRALRQATEKQKHYRIQAARLQKVIHENFEEAAMYEAFADHVYESPSEDVMEWLKKIEEMESL